MSCLEQASNHVIGLCKDSRIFTCTTGNHTFAVVRAQESYETLQASMGEVLHNINNLIANPLISIDGSTYQLDFFLGSDYKVTMKLAWTIIQCIILYVLPRIVPSDNNGYECSPFHLCLYMVQHSS